MVNDQIIVKLVGDMVLFAAISWIIRARLALRQASPFLATVGWNR